MRKSDYETFKEKFKPIKTGENIIDDDIFMYCNNEKVKSVTNDYVWTVVTGNSGNYYIIPGWHWVNREYYIITENPWKEGQRDYLY